MTMIATACNTSTEFKSQRIKKSAEILVDGQLENVFPLFGPVREKEWAHGWDPQIVYPENALVEEHMIFRTSSGHDEVYTWVVTQFDPAQHLVEYTVSTPERIWFIRVQCTAAGEKTRAVVSYTYTGLTEEGQRKNESALEKMFANELQDWEEAINYYLSTGTQLVAD